MRKTKTRPIICNATDVRAILDGRKTQTRRPIKSQPIGPEHMRYGGTDCDDDHIIIGDRSGNGLNIRNLATGASSTLSLSRRTCPYGQPGDRLWVRETWCVEKVLDGRKPVDIEYGVPVFYTATKSWRDWDEQCVVGKRRPSAHMPRWASRITLEITDVRVERVQEISREDSLAEGPHPYGWGLNDGTCERNFAMVWDSINAKRGYGWDSNPWVWVIEFKVIYPKALR